MVMCTLINLIDLYGMQGRTCPFFSESAIIFPIEFLRGPAIGFETFAEDSFPAPNISGKLVSNYSP